MSENRSGRTALITGITGQDGSYLAELLLQHGYSVVGLTRRSTMIEFDRLRGIQEKIEIVQGDLLDESSLRDVLSKYMPDEVYNLGGQSVVGVSWSQPVLDAESTAIGATRLLEAVRLVSPSARLYQASSSEMFGDPLEVPQTESTPYNPRNPYGAAKVYAHWMTRIYRNYHGIFAASGILYNHESPRRGLDFVPRKITHGAALIKMGLANELRLGNLEARRDWGFAGDCVRAMWLMLQQDEPSDYVIATGQTHSVKDICDTAFSYVGLDASEYVVSDPAFFRPAEESQLVGSAAKAKALLGWEPEVDFEEMVQMMVHEDLKRLRLEPSI
jgi:GDPmannose 4,6-dehydratase